MPKFRYIGEAPETMVGIAGARFIRNKINEVSDERLAGYLRSVPEAFEEVAVDAVPETPFGVSLMPHQGDPHHDPRVTAVLKDTGRKKDQPTPGNLARDDQREANTEAIAEKEAEAVELADKPAKKGK
jgi:hypothetical protein